MRVAKELTGRIESLYAEVGSRIRQVRVGKKLTQDFLAERVGLTRTSITNVEAGRQKLPLHTLFDIAQALDVAVADLLPAANRPTLDARDVALLRAPEVAEMTPAERRWFMNTKRVPGAKPSGRSA